MKQNAKLWGDAPGPVLRKFSRWLAVAGYMETPSAQKLGELFVDFCASCEAHKRGTHEQKV